MSKFIERARNRVSFLSEKVCAVLLVIGFIFLANLILLSISISDKVKNTEAVKYEECMKEVRSIITEKIDEEYLPTVRNIKSIYEKELNKCE